MIDMGEGPAGGLILAPGPQAYVVMRMKILVRVVVLANSLI